MTKLNPITTKAFHSGDTVMVLTGDDRGKKGRRDAEESDI